MDSHSIHGFSLLLVLSLISLRAQADGGGSIFFIDSPTHPYLRPHSVSDPVSQTDALCLTEVGAAISVMLGVVPQATLSSASSSKLNELLMPNPFDRPRSVFVVEVSMAEDSQLAIDANNNDLGSALKRGVTFGKSKADIFLSDEDEVFVSSLNEPSSVDPKAECTDKELSEFASSAGGSYVTDESEPLNGQLNIPLTNGGHLNLQMSKKADRDYVVGLFSLVRNTQNVIQLHKDLSTSGNNPSELIIGKFNGIRALQVQYGSGVAQQALEFFVASVSRMFGSLQSAYEGQMVGVILSGSPPSESETMLNIMHASHSSPRWLEETKGPFDPIKIREIVLVRKIVAWMTGIMLVIATLLGIHFLMNMSLTRDTLLYSNVKLD